MVKAQGGDLKALEERRLPEARFLIPWEAPREGYIHSLKADLIGRAAALMGAGRSRKEEAIDPAVGLVLDKKWATPWMREKGWACSTSTNGKSSRR